MNVYQISCKPWSYVYSVYSVINNDGGVEPIANHNHWFWLDDLMIPFFSVVFSRVQLKRGDRGPFVCCNALVTSGAVFGHQVSVTQLGCHGRNARNSGRRHVVPYLSDREWWLTSSRPWGAELTRRPTPFATHLCARPRSPEKSRFHCALLAYCCSLWKIRSSSPGLRRFRTLRFTVRISFAIIRCGGFKGAAWSWRWYQVVKTVVIVRVV